ncbi:FUSC family protein [Pseudolysobacter antarcticus]|nr:FUSC family protein [Pseudolysobacter antarcticus]
MKHDDLPAVIARKLAPSGSARAGSLLRALREACITMLSAIATLLITMLIAPGIGAGVLAVVLCISLSRSHLDRDRRGRIEAAIALPLVGLVAVGIGSLLQHSRWLGAVVFVAGMFVSIWLRRFGPMAGRAGSLIALPFVVLLTTPYIPAAPGGAIPALIAPIVVALLALLWVSSLHALAERIGFLPTRPVRENAPPAPRGESLLRPIASTRMAIQMAVALTVSFIVGYVWFADHWAWIVLTAFIVSSGNRGRLDVVYKSVLRVLGAAAGTFLALALSNNFGSHDTTTVVLILVAVFLGLWLRPLGYAWWALFVTLALALLQGFVGASTASILGLRMEEILIGAVIGVAASWFVLPVRSSAVLRRRIADALACLSDALDPANPLRAPELFIAALDAVEQLAPAFRASRLLTKHFRRLQPADWVDALLACRDPAIALIEKKATPVGARRAVGAARKSLREPTEILPALRDLYGSLTACAALDADPASTQPTQD